MKEKYPRHALRRYKTVKNCDTKTVENVWLFFEWGDSEIGVQVRNVANKKEALDRYYEKTI